MHQQFANRAEFQQRFQQEAQAAARLNHPSIVAVYHFGRQPDLLYIVMTYVQGLSLGAYLKQLAQRNQVVKLNETLTLLAQVADALGYAHRQGWSTGTSSRTTSSLPGWTVRTGSMSRRCGPS
jgi:serine/threonine protein kinase